MKSLEYWVCDELDLSVVSLRNDQILAVVALVH